MINRRTPRPSRAVENLQQFCLNNSAGIDCTAPHNNVKNVYDSTNLVSNPDGSLSLRKPLLIKRDWTKLVKTKIGADYTVLNVIPLYTEDAYLLFVSDTLGNSYIAIWDIDILSDSKFASSCTLMWTDKDATQHTKEFFNNSLGKVYSNTELDSLVNLNNVKTFHSATSTVLCNCRVGLNSTIFDDSPMSDISLYPSYSENTLLLMPRFIKVYRNYLHKWFFEIHNPEINTFEINPDTGTYEHPLNTTLDDIYNLQDNYNMSVPTVKQIVPYVYTERIGDYVNLVKYPENTTEVTVPHVTTHTFDKYFYNLTVSDTQTYSSETAHSVDDAGRCNVIWYFKCEPSYGMTDYTNKYFRKLKFTITIILEFFAKVSQTLQLHIPTSYGYLNYPTVAGRDTKEITIPEKTETVSLTSSSKHEMSSDCTFEFTQYYATNDELLNDAEYFATLEMNSSPRIQSDWTTTLYVTHLPDAISLSNTVADTKFRGVNFFPNNIASANTSIYLKAFCNFPKPSVPSSEEVLRNRIYLATWLYTLDGIVWHNMLSKRPTSGDAPDNSWETVIAIATDELPIESVDTGTDSNKEPNKRSTNTNYVPLFVKSADDVLFNRVDLLKIPKDFLTNLTTASFRFKIVLAEEDASNGYYEIIGSYGQADYVVATSQKGEYWYSDFGNSVLGEKLYHKSRIFSFGDPSFKNNIFVSEPGEFVIPFKNIIDIDASEDSVVTSVRPWKDYLFISTPQALYLATQVESGYLIKTANAALGIAQSDAKCVVPTLNSIIFKSGSKVYMFYPNIYAGDDSVINVTDVSSPIEHLLEGFDNTSGAFAFGTNSEYVLMLPNPQGTLCLSYDYTTRVWTKTEYPVRFTKHTVYSLTDVMLFGQNPEGDFCEYHYNKTFAEAYGNDVGAPYGDILVESKNGIAQDIVSYDTTNSTLEISPITFGLDTGQKAEAIVTTKQFVETKFVLATLDKADAFPMQLTVHIDGDPHIITRDISTDAAFWKDSSAKGVLNTTFSGLSDKSDIFNVLRQLIVRYSGKGKSIRHILEGQSLSNFKLYETYIRYKLLNVKQ